MVISEASSVSTEGSAALESSDSLASSSLLSLDAREVITSLMKSLTRHTPQKITGKAIPVTGHGSQQDCETSHFSDNYLTGVCV
jgi:hypothetical protein